MWLVFTNGDVRQVRSVQFDGADIVFTTMQGTEDRINRNVIASIESVRPE